jgi:pilus assembly protein CpaE
MDAIPVLIIDAEAASRNFLTQFLQKKNYAVQQAVNGEEGLRMAMQTLPKLIIFDVQLPDLRVADLMVRLRQNPVTAVIPCVVFTSQSDPDVMQACLEAGCVEYYIKSGTAMMALVDAIPKFVQAGKNSQTQPKKGFLYVFLSAKGGTGTSSLCANVGMNMASHLPNATVAVADLVLPMGSVAFIVGAADNEFNLVKAAEQPTEKITPGFLTENLIVPEQWLFHLLPGAPDPETSINLNVSHIPNIVDSMRRAYDHVLIDLGRSLSKISLPIILNADLIVLVLSTDLSTVNHTKKLWHYLKQQGVSTDRMFPVLNRAVGLEGLTKAEAEKILELEIKLTMPYMMGNFTLANNQNTPLSAKFPNDAAALMLKQAAQDMSQKVVKMQK